MTNECPITNVQYPMPSALVGKMVIGHWTLVIHWSLRHWTLVILSTIGFGELENCPLNLGHSLVIASLVIGHSLYDRVRRNSKTAHRTLVIHWSLRQLVMGHSLGPSCRMVCFMLCSLRNFC